MSLKKWVSSSIRASQAIYEKLLNFRAENKFRSYSQQNVIALTYVIVFQFTIPDRKWKKFRKMTKIE
jgi:poly(3-hydroxyalkanoate) synthetase